MLPKQPRWRRRGEDLSRRIFWIGSMLSVASTTMERNSLAYTGPKSIAEPSLWYVAVNSHGNIRTSRTEYILGRNSRSESRASAVGIRKAIRVSRAPRSTLPVESAPIPGAWGRSPQQSSLSGVGFPRSSPHEENNGALSWVILLLRLFPPLSRLQDGCLWIE